MYKCMHYSTVHIDMCNLYIYKYLLYSIIYYIYIFYQNYPVMVLSRMPQAFQGSRGWTLGEVLLGASKLSAGTFRRSRWTLVGAGPSSSLGKDISICSKIGKTWVNNNQHINFYYLYIYTIHITWLDFNRRPSICPIFSVHQLPSHTRFVWPTAFGRRIARRQKHPTLPWKWWTMASQMSWWGAETVWPLGSQGWQKIDISAFCGLVYKSYNHRNVCSSNFYQFFLAIIRLPRFAKWTEQYYQAQHGCCMAASHFRKAREALHPGASYWEEHRRWAETDELGFEPPKNGDIPSYPMKDFQLQKKEWLQIMAFQQLVPFREYDIDHGSSGDFQSVQAFAFEAVQLCDGTM